MLVISLNGMGVRTAGSGCAPIITYRVLAPRCLVALGGCRGWPWVSIGVALCPVAVEQLPTGRRGPLRHFVQMAIPAQGVPEPTSLPGHPNALSAASFAWSAQSLPVSAVLVVIAPSCGIATERPQFRAALSASRLTLLPVGDVLRTEMAAGAARRRTSAPPNAMRLQRHTYSLSYATASCTSAAP